MVQGAGAVVDVAVVAPGAGVGGVAAFRAGGLGDHGFIVVAQGFSGDKGLGVAGQAAGTALVVHRRLGAGGRSLQELVVLHHLVEGVGIMLHIGQEFGVRQVQMVRGLILAGIHFDPKSAGAGHVDIHELGRGAGVEGTALEPGQSLIVHIDPDDHRGTRRVIAL